MVNGWRRRGKPKQQRRNGKCWRQEPFILSSHSSIDSLRWPFLFLFFFFLQFFPTKQPDSRLLTKRLPKYHRLLFIRNFFPSLISSYTRLILDNQLAITIFGRREESIRWYEVDRWYICLKTSLLAQAMQWPQKKNGFNSIRRRSKITT